MDCPRNLKHLSGTRPALIYCGTRKRLLNFLIHRWQATDKLASQPRRTNLIDRTDILITHIDTAADYTPCHRSMRLANFLVANSDAPIVFKRVLMRVKRPENRH